MKANPDLLARFEFYIPWVILTVLAFFTYANFFHSPYPGFDFEADGRVSVIQESPNPQPTLQVGDRILQIGDVSWQQFRSDLRQKFFPGANTGDIVSIRVARDGQILLLNWVYPGVTREHLIGRLAGVWWLTYVFWIAGTATLFFIRPKDVRWKLFVAFNFLTAFGLASGGVLSHWHIGYSAIILRSAVWLAVPVYLHFHWIFPRSLFPIPNFIWSVLYLVAGILVLGEWFQIFDQNLFYLGFTVGVCGSAFFLILHLVFQRRFRQDILVLLASIILVLAPPMFTTIFTLRGHSLTNLQQSASLLTFPALPGIYFFMVYRSQYRDLERMARRPLRFYLLAIVAAFGLVVFYSLALTRFDMFTSGGPGFSAFAIILGMLLMLISFYPFMVLPALTGATYGPIEPFGRLVIRPNRLVTSFLFLVFAIGGLAILIVIADALFRFPGKAIVIATTAALMAGALVAFAYQPFRRLMEQRVLHMPLPPTQLLETYASRITTSLDRDNLVKLLKHEVLPTLLIRQSALIWLKNHQDNIPLYTLGVSNEHLPNNGDIAGLLEFDGMYRRYQTNSDPVQPFPWIRLTLPLRLGQDLIGVWLLGSRDPDDYYSPGEITILQALADQTAIALTNILQSEQLRGLYQANIARQETERKQLALFLHDEVLNELAALGMQIDLPDFSSRFLEVRQSLDDSIRQIIAGLRPMMLNYGLGPALEELVENLIEQSNPGINIGLHLTPFGMRYDPDFEAHLYWIVHQACENALQHAQPRNVNIYGQLQAAQLTLRVEDDGIGFETKDQPDLLDLFNNRHYGFVGMHERAAIIGAQLSIASKPGMGTCVSVTWDSEGSGTSPRNDQNKV